MNNRHLEKCYGLAQNLGKKVKVLGGLGADAWNIEFSTGFSTAVVDIVREPLKTLRFWKYPKKIGHKPHVC